MSHDVKYHHIWILAYISSFVTYHQVVDILFICAYLCLMCCIVLLCCCSKIPKESERDWERLRKTKMEVATVGPCGFGYGGVGGIRGCKNGSGYGGSVGVVSAHARVPKSIPPGPILTRPIG